MSERYLRFGDSEFTPAGKPFVISPHSRADMVRPIRVPDWLAFPWFAPSRIRETRRANSDRSRTTGNGDHVRSREYTATEGFWPGHGRRNPGLSGEAALIRISPNFRLTRKGQSIMIRRQE
jgi:hypothetical protein